MHFPSWSCPRAVRRRQPAWAGGRERRQSENMLAHLPNCRAWYCTTDPMLRAYTAGGCSSFGQARRGNTHHPAKAHGERVVLGYEAEWPRLGGPQSRAARAAPTATQRCRGQWAAEDGRRSFPLCLLVMRDASPREIPSRRRRTSRHTAIQRRPAVHVSSGRGELAMVGCQPAP